MDQSPTTPRPFRIGIFPLPGYALLSYACTVEPLRAANLLSGKPLYEVVHFDEGAPAISSANTLAPRRALVGDVPPLDMFLVLAGGDPMAFQSPKISRWLAHLARATPQIGGVSGGPVILALAGLMSHRRMTVHWEHAPGLAELFPDLLLERRLFVIDRDRVTCGGGTSPLDLMHALLTEHHGADFARQVSEWFLHTDIRAAADPQRGGLIQRLGTTSLPILAAVEAMENHIADPLTLDQLALISGITSRQLNRLAEVNLGSSVMAFYRALRLDVALRLLNHSPLPLTEIALATGFSSSAHFSSAFSKKFGHPPSKARS